MSEADDYLDARDEAARLVDRAAAFKMIIGNFLVALTRTPEEALRALPSAWPSRQELEDLLRASVNAFEQMESRWNLVSADHRSATRPPFGSLSEDVDDGG
ncbi:MAG TPA: hypothetical protein VN806_02505 [Caulobacteraceae bacterium]|nr:hypothetical protein [Caulobacteraceae bacterium]